MPKNIVICADGTGNSTIKGRGTNVFKLYEAVDGNGHRMNPRLMPQVAIYHDGVGTESLKWLRVFSGATGWGLSRNVKQLYGELARVYNPGDRICLFGFSRGAFTVRTLAGLITTCGILDVSRYVTNHSFREAIRVTYDQYRRKYQTWLSLKFRGPQAAVPETLREHHYVETPGFTEPGVPVIHFIGVWDTVDAVGLPLRMADIVNTLFWRFKFPDTALSSKVEYACQALALDEARESFAPLLWNESKETPSTPGRIDQVWFAGAHSNVGGGYPRQGMSLTTLDWMMSRAEAHEIRFHPAVRDLYRGAADVNDKRYDSRAGLGVFYRWKPRDVEQLCQAGGVDGKVHRSVFERIARSTEGYAPGSLPTRCQVISTSAPANVRDSIAAIVAAAFDPGLPLLRRARRWQYVGQFGYALLILATVAIAGLMLWKYFQDSRSTGGVRATIGGLISYGFSSHWLTIAATTAWHHPWVIGLAAGALILLVWADSRLDNYYSSFWHNVREKLRLAI